MNPDRLDSRVPGIILGLGLGGFVDGILLHQIAQWHNMGSAVLPPTTMEAMQRNMRWDGLFHAAVWLLTVAGVYGLLRDARRGLRLPGPLPFTGLLLLGWGLFNLGEGVVDHHLLAPPRARPAGPCAALRLALSRDRRGRVQPGRACAGRCRRTRHRRTRALKAERVSCSGWYRPQRCR